MKNYTLIDLLHAKLRALYDIENQIVKALPKLIKAATHPSLKEALKDHLEETRNHVMRLEQIFTTLGERPQKLKAEAIRGLVKDAKWILENIKPASALDANIIAAAQYVEHYEMAGYGSAQEWARELELEEVVSLLGETLAEEKAADQKLNEIAMAEVNPSLV